MWRLFMEKVLLLVMSNSLKIGKVLHSRRKCCCLIISYARKILRRFKLGQDSQSAGKKYLLNICQCKYPKIRECQYSYPYFFLTNLVNI